MIKHGVGITPDRYLLVLLIGSVFLHRALKFLHDFLPFILIIVGYDYIRGFVDQINQNIHYVEPINITKWLFNGHIPTIELQSQFYTPGVLHWYDMAATLLYLLHFAVPLAFAYFIWTYNKRYFKEFSLGFAILSYGAVLTYLIYPTAPPWLAALHGNIPPVTKIFNVALEEFPDVLHLPSIYQAIDANLVAAVPSMHASYPFLVFLYAARYFKWWSVLILPYAVLMCITIIYLGEHYLIDIVVGLVYCFIAYYLSILIVKHHIKVRSLFQSFSKPILYNRFAKTKVSQNKDEGEEAESQSAEAYRFKTNS